MKNFTSVFFFVACLLVGIVNTGIAQSTRLTQHPLVNSHVVNMTDVPEHQSPIAQTTAPVSLAGITGKENNPFNPATSRKETGTSKDSLYDAYPSPLPSTSFVAQAYDGYESAYPHGAVSENYIVSTSRYTIVIQNRLGTVLGQRDLYNFWSQSISIGGIWENRIEYDPSVQRWIMGCFSDEFTDTAGVLIGISQTENPMGNWNLYKVRADSTGKHYSDVPFIGFNKNFIAIGGQYSHQTANTVDTDIIYVFDKQMMINDNQASYSSVTINDARLSLAVTYDTLIENLYILGEWNNTTGQLILYKIAGLPGAETLSLVSYPTSSVPYAGSAPNLENFAPQEGTNLKFQASNDQPTSLVYMNGNLWCAQTVFLPSNSPTRSSIQWLQIDTIGNVLQLGLVDDTTGTLFFDYPSIAVNQYNDALIGYSVFSQQMYASCGYSFHNHSMGLNSTDSPCIYHAGENIYTDSSSNGDIYWGGWSATVIDPLDNTGFWTIQQYAASTVDNWGMWWANVDESNASVGNILPVPQINIYPNPGDGQFQISSTAVDGFQTKSLAVYNLLGQKILQLQFQNPQQKINLSSEPNGIYLVLILNPDGSIAAENKVIKTDN